MKIILCTPYKNSPDVVRGGINQWGQNILSYYNYINEEGLRVIPISFDRHISKIHTKSAFQRFIYGMREQISPFLETIKALKKEDPDLVHICSSAGMGCIRDYLIVKIAQKYQIKSALHLHFGRIPELANKRNLEWKLLKIVLKQCDVIVSMNKPTEKTLHELSFTNVCYLPNPLGNDIVKQIANFEKYIQRNNKQLLYVGHVYKTKGVFELVEGCSSIDGVNLRIVGKYTQEIKKELQTIASKFGRTNWVDFIGEIPHNEVLKEFLNTDIFVFPSYTEGFPNVILEAMACGCPIIASNVGAIPEMLNISVLPCGVCIEPKSPLEVHDAIMNLIDNTQIKTEYANRARKRVNTLYTMPVVWRELVKIWKSATI